MHKKKPILHSRWYWKVTYCIKTKQGEQYWTLTSKVQKNCFQVTLGICVNLKFMFIEQLNYCGMNNLSYFLFITSTLKTWSKWTNIWKYQMPLKQLENLDMINSNLHNGNQLTVTSKGYITRQKRVLSSLSVSLENTTI